MSCEKIHELMPDVAAGTAHETPEMSAHLKACSECENTLKAMRETMALLDDWKSPEPSPFFDTRLQARLREERDRPAGMFAGAFAWVRRPVFGAVAVVALAAGAAFLTGDRFPGKVDNQRPTMARGTAVGDLYELDKQSDLLQDFDALDSSPDDDNSPQVN